MKAITYQELTKAEIGLSLFSKFNRYQKVNKSWRKEDGEWVLKENSFIDQWDSDNYKELVEHLKNTIETGGVVFGAFIEKELVGFASLENQLFGTEKQYLQLSSIHTTYEKRGLGIGKKLFSLVCEQAIKMGAKKLYISAHSSEETQAFYKVLGCIEAKEYNQSLVAEEPYDCQLEYDLFNNDHNLEN